MLTRLRGHDVAIVAIARIGKGGWILWGHSKLRVLVGEVPSLQGRKWRAREL